MSLMPSSEQPMSLSSDLQANTKLLQYNTFNTRITHTGWLKQAGHSPVIIKFPNFSRHFQWIFMQYWPSHSSNTKRNACYFSLQYSYILSPLWQLCSSV